MRVEVTDWPNDYKFTVWAPSTRKCYRICATDVLEFHYARIGVGRLEGLHDGIPLDGIFIDSVRDRDHWHKRVKAFAKQGYDSGVDPICLEFVSHLFANRNREPLVRNRNTGLLVVCRQMQVSEDYDFDGPWPDVFRIPSAD